MISLAVKLCTIAWLPTIAWLSNQRTISLSLQSIPAMITDLTWFKQLWQIDFIKKESAVLLCLWHCKG